MGRKKKRKAASDHDRSSTRRTFKIPGKVEVRRHVVTDELTELTQTFNDMSDELVKQYTLLDEKVADRTRELEISKKAAEAANESKTLFIANISHELKTPLNGILGMCAVCMEENDILRIKQSLKTLYKSGTNGIDPHSPAGWVLTVTTRRSAPPPSRGSPEFLQEPDWPATQPRRKGVPVIGYPAADSDNFRQAGSGRPHQLLCPLRQHGGFRARDEPRTEKF